LKRPQQTTIKYLPYNVDRSGRLEAL